MRVIVTGSRSWREPGRIHEALDAVCAAGDLTVVHGDHHQGADYFVRDWCKQAQYRSDIRVTEERHPADWQTHGKRAGPVRNKEMVRSGADLVLAFADYCCDPACPQWDTDRILEYIMSEECKFGVTIHYGTRSLEWRPQVGISDDRSLSLSNSYSRWEMSLIRLLLQEFDQWFQENR